MGGYKYKTDGVGSGAEERGSPGQGQGETGEPEPTSRVDCSPVGSAGRTMSRRDETSRAHDGARRHAEPHDSAGYEVSALGEGSRSER